MEKFMINILYGNGVNATPPQDDTFVMKKYMEWSEKIRSKTLLAHKLFDGEGRKLELDSGKVVDGPFTETKETVGGFYIITAENYDEAVRLAHECPTLLYQGGTVEVRRVEM
jgi:hypothetical protein